MQVARHPNRPSLLDYVETLLTDFIELHGDRRFADDPALIAGFANSGSPCSSLDTTRVAHQAEFYRNFGYAKPEGYRKALRAMRARRASSAADPGVRRYAGGLSRESSPKSGASPSDREESPEMSTCPCRSSFVVAGEGGSGARWACYGRSDSDAGARDLQRDPPEGCAAILWRDAGRKVEPRRRSS